MFLILYFTICLLLLNSYFVVSLSGDEITSLPGLSHNPKFKQYSGYLNATKGRHYFYWFVESQNNSIKDPLILWLNGGPGCSSLFGFFGENGPFKVKGDGKTLVENINSWNTIANVLYLESPAGVGFSYDENISLPNSDKLTAEDNFLALQSFFKKFPQLMNNKFYISGESYAGVYIPMLAIEIFKRDPSINLKGIGLGNALLDNQLNSHIEYAFSHGLISTDLVNQLTVDCCKCFNNTKVCDFEQPSNPKCSSQQLWQIIIPNPNVNVYNIYDDCPQPNGFTNHYKQIANTFGFEYKSNEDINNEGEYSSSGTECLGDGYIRYLNLNEVRKAIHVNEKIEKWIECSNKSYTYDRDVIKNNMKPEIMELIIKYKIQTLIVFNGDFDIVCDFIGNQQFVDGLGLKVTQKYRKWSVNGFTAGFVKRHEGITFMTIRGAGHMVPTDKPEAALKMVKELVGISKVDE